MPFTFINTPTTGFSLHQIACLCVAREVVCRAIGDEHGRGFMPVINVEGRFFHTYDLTFGTAAEAVRYAEGQVGTVRDTALLFTTSGQAHHDVELAAKVGDGAGICCEAVAVGDGVWVGLMFGLDQDDQRLLFGYTNPVEDRAEAISALRAILERHTMKRAA